MESIIAETAEAGRILIVRHAQSVANAGEKTADSATIPITATGILQARCVADFVSHPPKIVCVSSYLRTIQTADPLLLQYPSVAVEQWPVEEFTYLDTTACAGTTYEERKARRDEYWKKCDPLWVDGSGCECFAGFVARVRQFEQTLNLRGEDDTVVVFTHGLVMRALLWISQRAATHTDSAEMADFKAFSRSVSVPNCSVLRAEPNRIGRLRLSVNVFAGHIPPDLRTE